MREGHIATIKLLIELGADIDHNDTKNQRPLYYAIQHDRHEMTKFMIDRGVNLNAGDKKGVTPTMWAKKLNKTEILSLLLEAGAAAPVERPKQKDNRRPVKQPEPVQPKVIENERKIPRRYMLTKLREGGFYSPMTDQEFEEFKRQSPEIAAYFELNEDDEAMKPISDLKVPEVPESAPIFDQWVKAAQRLLTTL